MLMNLTEQIRLKEARRGSPVGCKPSLCQRQNTRHNLLYYNPSLYVAVNFEQIMQFKYPFGFRLS